MSGTDRTEGRGIRSFALYGERDRFPDVLHCETIRDRASRNDWVIGTHRHPLLHQLLLIETGHVELSIDGAHRSVEGPVILNIPKDHVHGFRFTAGVRGYVLSLPAEDLPGLCYEDEAVLAALSRPGVTTAGEALVAAFRRILGWHAETRPVRRAMLRALACEIACLTAERTRVDASSVPPSRQAEMIEEFEALVQRHLRDRWSVAQFAAALGVSPTHLSRVCRRQTGVSASAWIDRAVVLEACRALAYTTEPVSRIAYELGYEDPSHFSRVFRRVMGTSPSAYRA